MNTYNSLLDRIKRSWKFEYYLLLGSIVVVVFYIVRLQLFLNPLALSNDNYALSYPQRILVSSSIQNGIFPLWDHWTHGGMPFNTPLTPIAFSPIVLLLSLFGVYTVSTFEIEILMIHIICFIGMYLWLTFYSSKFSSLVIAFCFTLIGAQIITSPLNVEAVVSVALLPWLGVGMKYCMRGTLKGIGILALAVWIMMTTGYLGMNVIFIEFIALFCILEAIILAIKKDSDSNLVPLGILHIFYGLLLGVLIVNYPFIENFTHYGTSFITMRDAAFTPYYGSVNIHSLLTLFFPNHVLSFSGDEFFAITGNMFFGSIPIYMAMYALMYRKFRFHVFLLLGFSILSFLATLSLKYPFSRWISMNVPLLQYIRWHIWLLPASVFFLATISSIGMNAFLGEKRRSLKCIAFVVFISVAALVSLWQSASMNVPIFTYLLYPQIITYVSLGIIIFISHQKVNKLIYVLPVADVIVVSWSIVLLGSNLLYTGLSKQEASHREIIKNTTKNFPEISNQRSTVDSHLNPQYYTKQPTLYGYNPVIYPIMATLINEPEYPLIMKYLFYPVNTIDQPEITNDFKIQSIRLTPNSAEARIDSTSTGQTIVWSSPYNSFWKLFIDGIPTATRKNRFGLTQFTIQNGRHSVRFVYTPPYVIPSSLLSLVSIGTSLYLITRKPKNKIRTI